MNGNEKELKPVEGSFFKTQHAKFKKMFAS